MTECSGVNSNLFEMLFIAIHTSWESFRDGLGLATESAYIVMSFVTDDVSNVKDLSLARYRVTRLSEK